jgi:hypothetical protein
LISRVTEPPLIPQTHQGITFVEGRPNEPLMQRTHDAMDLLEHAFAARTNRVLLHDANVTPNFFDLSSGEAGEVHQKLRSYGLKLAIVRGPDVTVSSRFTEILTDDLGVFPSRDEAVAWLCAEPRGNSP